MIQRIAILLFLLTGNVYSQITPFEDPYGDVISSFADIDTKFFQDIIEEISFEIEEYAFEDAVGAAVDTSSYIRTYENYIDMPAQFSNSFVYNMDFGEVRMIYNFGPTQRLKEEIAKEWYEGLVKIFDEGNEERNWGFVKKVEPNAAGLPERTTFFGSLDDYTLNHVEIYYTRSRDLSADEEVYKGRVVMIFVFPGY